MWNYREITEKSSSNNGIICPSGYLASNLVDDTPKTSFNEKFRSTSKSFTGVLLQKNQYKAISLRFNFNFEHFPIHFTKSTILLYISYFQKIT